MDFVVEEDLKAHLTCWYIQKYVKENPQPQYFEHIYQWPYLHGSEEREELEKETPGREILCMQHALELQDDKQQRTFQALFNMTLSESQDNWSHTKDVCKVNVGSTGQLRPHHEDSARAGSKTAGHNLYKPSNQRLSMLPQAETSRIYTQHWLEANIKHVLRADVSQMLKCVANFPWTHWLWAALPDDQPWRLYMGWFGYKSNSDSTDTQMVLTFSF